jgi:PPOX class probable F420-dependent enzyme
MPIPACLETHRTLLESPAPAVLTTYRRDGSAHTAPVWFRWTGQAFDVVIAEGDAKLDRLRRKPHCRLLIFESVPPFRGVEVVGDAVLFPDSGSMVRKEIATRYLGRDHGEQFAAERSTPGMVVRLTSGSPRIWDLSAILPRTV